MVGVFLCKLQKIQVHFQICKNCLYDTICSLWDVLTACVQFYHIYIFWVNAIQTTWVSTWDQLVGNFLAIRKTSLCQAAEHFFFVSGMKSTDLIGCDRCQPPTQTAVMYFQSNPVWRCQLCHRCSLLDMQKWSHPVLCCTAGCTARWFVSASDRRGEKGSKQEIQEVAFNLTELCICSF